MCTQISRWNSKKRWYIINVHLVSHLSSTFFVIFFPLHLSNTMPMHIWRIFSCFRMFSKALAWGQPSCSKSCGFLGCLAKYQLTKQGAKNNSRQLETFSSNFAHPSAVDFTVGLQWETKSSESTWPFFSIIWHFDILSWRKLSFFYEGLGEACQICDEIPPGPTTIISNAFSSFLSLKREIIPRQDLTTNWLTATERSIFHWLPWTYWRYYTPWN